MGVATNLGFLLETLAHRDVVEGRVDTDWIERTWRGHAPTLPDGVRVTDSAGRDPWHAFGPKPSPSHEVVVARGWAQYRGWAYRLADDELEAVWAFVPIKAVQHFIELPAWTTHRHENPYGQDAYLYSMNDWPAQQALGQFYYEEF